MNVIKMGNKWRELAFKYNKMEDDLNYLTSQTGTNSSELLQIVHIMCSTLPKNTPITTWKALAKDPNSLEVDKIHKEFKAKNLDKSNTFICQLIEWIYCEEIG